MKKIFMFLLYISLLFSIYGCSDNQKQSEKIICSFSYEEMSLKDAVQTSTCAIVGSFSNTTDFSDHVYQTFTVDDVVFGSVDESSVDVFELRTQENMEDIYNLGEQYVLLLRKTAPTIFEPDGHYIASSVLIMFPIDGPYTMYGKELQVPLGLSFPDYIRSLWCKNPSAVSSTQDDFPSVTYDSVEQEIAEESQFLGYVTIDALDYDGAEYTNVYVCSVSTLLKGSSLSTMEDGTILLALAKGEVSVGNEYLIGFDHRNADSRIYTQSTLTSIISTADQDQIESILHYLKKD